MYAWPMADVYAAFPFIKVKTDIEKSANLFSAASVKNFIPNR